MTTRPNLQIECHSCPGRPRSIFCHLEGEALKELNVKKSAQIYKKGQDLFVTGESPLGLFCVHSGRIKVFKTNSEGVDTIVRILGSGDVAGHRSLFSESAMTASARVIEEAQVCFVPRDAVHSLAQKEPRLCCDIVNRISKEMGAAEDKLASMARKSVRERFAETLLLLKESFGVEVNGGVKVDIRLTREELAQIVGAASENIIRLITDFKDQGYLFEQNKNFVLIDIPAIENEAGLDCSV